MKRALLPQATSSLAFIVQGCLTNIVPDTCHNAVRTIETQHRWEKPGITNPGFEVDPTASILDEKFNMKGKAKAGI